MIEKYLAELDEIRNKYKYDDKQLSAYLTGYLDGRKDEAKSLQDVINRATEIWYEGGIDG